MALSMREGCELERMTVAPCSRQASATQWPMPEVPPMMRMRLEWSLVVYFWASGAEDDIVVGGWVSMVWGLG